MTGKQDKLTYGPSKKWRLSEMASKQDKLTYDRPKADVKWDASKQDKLTYGPSKNGR